MINFLRKIFCKHDWKVIDKGRQGYSHTSFERDESGVLVRVILFCPKCGTMKQKKFY